MPCRYPICIRDNAAYTTRQLHPFLLFNTVLPFGARPTPPPVENKQALGYIVPQCEVEGAFQRLNLFPGIRARNNQASRIGFCRFAGNCKETAYFIPQPETRKTPGTMQTSLEGTTGEAHKPSFCSVFFPPTIAIRNETQQHVSSLKSSRGS